MTGAPSSSCKSEDRKFDTALDQHMMKTITDVKYVKNRPKFIVFGDVNFQRECLDAHNALRQKYGCNPLTWSQELADLAHTWAEKLLVTGRILYPELTGIGDNIRLSTTVSEDHLPSGLEVVDFWGREADGFSFDAPKWQTNCQHFTQMVWRETEELGVARCWQSAKGVCAIVAFYRPGGNSNAPGEFRANVPSKSLSMLLEEGGGRPSSVPPPARQPAVAFSTIKRSTTTATVNFSSPSKS
uniref:SCP domain-containing protein n=1 Tax=Plectus sambesii TaxID=2011161 RepID=A0A914X3R0_9BILA